MPIDLLETEFESEVRKRGEDYADAGRVRRLSVRRDCLTAEVHGSDIYDVAIEFESRGRQWDLLALCTCPYAEIAPCKHMWAALVRAREKIADKWGPPPRKILLYIDDEEFADALNDPDDDGEDPSESPFPDLFRSDAEAHRPGGASGSRQDPARQAWRRLLSSAPQRFRYHEQAAPHAPIQPLRYIIDTKRSSLNGVMTLALATTAKQACKPKRIPITVSSIPAMTDEADRAICSMLIGAARPGRESAFYLEGPFPNAAPSSLWQINHTIFPVLLPMLFQTGRFFWTPSDIAPPRPLATERDPWELSFIIEPSEKPGTDHAGEYMLRAGLVRGDESIHLDQCDIVFDGSPGYALHANKLVPVRSDTRPGVLPWLKRLNPAEVAPADALPLLRSLHDQGLQIPVRWPKDWPVRERDDIAPRPRLTVKASDTSAQQRLDAKLAFLYGEHAVAEADGECYAHVPAADGLSETTLIRRRPEDEQKAAARLAELGVKYDPYRTGRATVAAKQLSPLATTLIDEGWEVRGENGLFRSPGKVDIRVSSGIDWFDVHGEADFGGVTAPIADLLAALKRGESFVTLGDGTQGVLPEKWLERTAGWMRLGETEGEGVRFSRSQVTLLDAMLAEMPEAVCDEQFAQARRKLAEFDGIRPAKPPRAFRGELRPYQQLGLGWLRFLDEFGFGGCLADDMGLGKTVQVLAFLVDRAARKSKDEHGPWLLVVPRSLVFNWLGEAERFAPSLRVSDYSGPDRAGADSAFADADLVLATYGTMRRDIECLREVNFAGVVLDEAQAIKNPTSQVAKAARLLRARRRLALTGTPIENSLEDLWSIFEFLNPGMLGSTKAFASIARSSPEGTDIGLIRRTLRPFILRRTKNAVAPELPERTEQTISCELVGRQRTMYDSLRNHYRDRLLGRIDREGLNKSRMHVLEALLRLRQAACHAALIEPKANRSRSGKLQTLLDMLAEVAAEGNKSLVFSQFTSLLDLVQHDLDARNLAHERLDGKTPAKERKRRVERFQSDAGPPVFLISLKAGGVGLNLTAAQYVFLLDPWWNPAAEAQAIDRTHRIGQNRKVSAYRLITKGTVEERILDLQATKRELAEAIVTEQKGALKTLTRDDIERLLG